MTNVKMQLTGMHRAIVQRVRVVENLWSFFGFGTEISFFALLAGSQGLGGFDLKSEVHGGSVFSSTTHSLRSCSNCFVQPSESLHSLHPLHSLRPTLINPPVATVAT